MLYSILIQCSIPHFYYKVWQIGVAKCDSSVDYKVWEEWVTKCDRLWITKWDKMEKESGITKCIKVDYKVWQRLQSGTEITKFDGLQSAAVQC